MSLSDKIRKIIKDRLIKNMSLVLIGDTLTSVISLINLYLITKALGITGLGMFTVIQTYANTFGQILSIQAFRATIRWMADCLEKRDTVRAKRYLVQGLTLEVIASILAIVAGEISLPFIGHLFDWNAHMTAFIRIYLPSILLGLTTPLAVVRVYDEFGKQTIVNSLIAVVRLIAYIVGFLTKQTLGYFVICELAIGLLSTTLLFYVSVRILRAHQMYDFRTKLSIDKDFFLFCFYNNLVTTLDLPVGYLTTFFIDKYMGLHAVGIYNLVQRFGNVLNKFASPISQVIYPEFSRLVANRQFVKAKALSNKILVYTTALGGAFTLLFSIAYLIVGKEHFPLGITPMVVYILFVTFSLGFIGIHELFIALGYVSYNIPILVIVNSVYIVILMTAVRGHGLSLLFWVLFIQVLCVALPKYVIVYIKERAGGISYE